MFIRSVYNYSIVEKKIFIGFSQHIAKLKEELEGLKKEQQLATPFIDDEVNAGSGKRESKVCSLVAFIVELI